MGMGMGMGTDIRETAREWEWELTSERRHLDQIVVDSTHILVLGQIVVDSRYV